MRTKLLLATLLAATTLVLVPSSAQAASRVNATNEFGTAQADPTYATKLTLRGSGFQSIRNGHGGVYVFFGTTQGQWRPSKGGQTGTNYLYVPDSEAKNNQGYQRFIAFPGSDTASSAQGVIKADGSWSTTITIPGAKFNAVDRNGRPAPVDCLKVTCGIITLGAHGVKNAQNESFTPVRFTKLYDSAPEEPAADPTGTPTPGTGQPATTPPTTVDNSAVEATAVVDHETAVVGRVLTFSGSGFTPGEQVTASFDSGKAAVGPLPAGPSGEVGGVLQLPLDLKAGTHTLRLSGAASGKQADVNFPVAADPDAAVTPVAAEDDSDGLPAWAGWTFLGVAVLVLGAAAFFALRRFRGLRQNGQQEAVHAS